jgi:23S rRNA (guanine1835-N2)-methyltransferase
VTALQFDHPFGSALLARRPDLPQGALQAWDGADALLLEEVRERAVSPVGSALVVNDQFGALAVALADAGIETTSWGDSRTAHLALATNLERNGIVTPVATVPATATPALRPHIVLWRVPKSLALLQQQAARLGPLLNRDTVVLAAGMDKHLPPTTAQLLGVLGEVERLPGRRKAHLFVIAPDPARPAPVESPMPRANVREFDLVLTGDANVFASSQLASGGIDIGARLLIEQFEKLPPADRVADLGCGNGLLGIVLQRQRPSATLHFFDDSYQAVAAATCNHAHNCPDAPAAAFHCDDGLSSYQGEPFDLVLCNPPFHQGHAVGDHIARQLFRQAKHHLRPGGELWVVGNRHLRYDQVLKSLFGHCKRVADNPKFTVLAARR